jgi:hypothetical protein
MGRQLEDFLKEADALIEKNASKPKAAPADDEVVKLAHMLTAKDNPLPDHFEFTPLEKIAYSIAIVETMQNMEQLEKIAKFEEGCREKGFTEAQIQEFLTKRADAKSFAVKHVLPAAVTGAAGLAYGHKKGKEKGYRNALDDVQKAFSAQSE